MTNLEYLYANDRRALCMKCAAPCPKVMKDGKRKVQ